MQLVYSAGKPSERNGKVENLCQKRSSGAEELVLPIKARGETPK